MFLKIYDLRVKFLINYKMVCLEQIHIIFLNFADNYYQQYCNGLILIQQLLREEHSHHFFSPVILLSVLPSNFIASGVKSKIISIFNFKCKPIFIFTDKDFDWGVINTFTMFFKNILKIILNT